MRKHSLIVGLLAMAACCSAACCSFARAEPKLKALVVDGQNNHGVWPKTTQMMKKYLEETGLFSVDIATTRQTGDRPQLQTQLQRFNTSRMVQEYGTKYYLPSCRRRSPGEPGPFLRG